MPEAGTRSMEVRGDIRSSADAGVEVIFLNRVKNLIILLLDGKQERKVTHEKLKD